MGRYLKTEMLSAGATLSHSLVQEMPQNSVWEGEAYFLSGSWHV